MSRLYDFAEKVLFTEEELKKRIQLIARRIADDYKDEKLSFFENPLILVSVLKGSFVFAADLCRALGDCNVPVKLEFICVSSYGASVTSSGQVQTLLDTHHSIQGRHVMIVEDIVDTALTMKYLHNVYGAREPASIKTVVLLDKPEGRKVVFDADYVVATVPNLFVVGYGLDYDGAFREVRDVVVLRSDVHKKNEERKKAKQEKDALGVDAVATEPFGGKL